MSLAEEAASYGAELNWADFTDLIQEVHKTIWPNFSDERLVCDTPEADKFCNEVRSRLRLKVAKLPNHIINRALINLRKCKKQNTED